MRIVASWPLDVFLHSWQKFMWETQIWSLEKKETRMPQKHKVLGQFLRAFIDLFCSVGLGRNFERKAWKVGTNEQRSPDGTGHNGAGPVSRRQQYWDKCVPPHKKDANVWRPYGFWNFLTISDNLMDWVNPPFKQFNWVWTKAIMHTQTLASWGHLRLLMSRSFLCLAFWTSQWITMKLPLFVSRLSFSAF